MQKVKRLLVDCDADTLVAVVDSPGPACHTGHRSCFFKEIEMGA
jgi:phosphoribosyl-AMP cyclohydrolase/phosphoribosyl-ATP pyrophosphohydrolase/phosphoribosyl-AMP cyclohydrolase